MKCYYLIYVKLRLKLSNSHPSSFPMSQVERLQINKCFRNIKKLSIFKTSSHEIPTKRFSHQSKSDRRKFRDVFYAMAK